MNKLKDLGMHAGASPQIFQNAKILRANLTEQEAKLWEYLKLKPSGYKFRKQHPFFEYVLDFYCHALKLSIEIDGHSHNSATQMELDAVRTKVVNDFGITEIRFTNEQIDYSFRDVVEVIEGYF